MNRLVFISAFAAVSLVASADVPTVSNVRMSQASGRTVTITYDLLDADGIVTFDICTNGVSIGAENVRFYGGDVACLVRQGTGKKIIWHPDRSWPGNKVTDASVTAVVTAWTPDSPPDYLCVNLIDGSSLYYPSEGQLPGGVTNDLYKTSRMLFRKIPAKGITWTIGSPETENSREYAVKRLPITNEAPHQVTLSKDYYIGVYEVTQSQLSRLTTLDVNRFTNELYAATRPANNLRFYNIRGGSVGASSWPNDDIDLARAVDAEYDGHATPIHSIRDLTGIRFDLPTEAQWEFACRAGCSAALYTNEELTIDGNFTETVLDNIGRYRANGEGGMDADAQCGPESGTALVGSYTSNRYGLYDMLGNVSEWCLDRCSAFTATEKPVTDPAGAPYVATDDNRILRGGSWYTPAMYLRAATRQYNNGVSSAFGFRLCWTLGE